MKKLLWIGLLISLTGCSTANWKQAVEKAQAEQRARPKVVLDDFLMCQNYSHGGGRCTKKVGSRLTRCSYDKHGTYCSTKDDD